MNINTANSPQLNKSKLKAKRDELYERWLDVRGKEASKLSARMVALDDILDCLEEPEFPHQPHDSSCPVSCWCTKSGAYKPKEPACTLCGSPFQPHHHRHVTRKGIYHTSCYKKEPANQCGAVISHDLQGTATCANSKPCPTHASREEHIEQHDRLEEIRERLDNLYVNGLDKEDAQSLLDTIDRLRESNTVMREGLETIINICLEYNMTKKSGIANTAREALRKAGV